MKQLSLQTSVGSLTAVDQRIPGAVRASLRPIEWLGLRAHSRLSPAPKRSTGDQPRNWRTVLSSNRKGPGVWNTEAREQLQSLRGRLRRPLYSLRIQNATVPCPFHCGAREYP